jgi:hypothetical protein
MNDARPNVEHLRRRTLLAAIGSAAGSSLLAGCLVSDGSDESTNPDENGTPNGNGSGNGTGTDTGNGTANWGEGGEQPRSRFSGDSAQSECPPYDNVDKVVCYDAIADDTDTVDAYLEPSTRTFRTDESVEFTLHNTSNQVLQTNFYNWNVHKYVDGEWYYVAPREWNEPLMELPPDGSHAWTLSVDNAGIDDGTSIPRVSATENVTLAGLGGGQYAFRARGWLADDGYENAQAFAATVEFDADAIVLTPTSAIESTEWDGETLVAHSTRGDADDEAFTYAAYELQHVENPEKAPTSMITEQVLRNDQLRDTLALSYRHGASTVRLEEYTGITPVFGARSEGVIEFQGETFVVTTRELDPSE